MTTVVHFCIINYTNFHKCLFWCNVITICNCNNPELGILHFCFAFVTRMDLISNHCQRKYSTYVYHQNIITWIYCATAFKYSILLLLATFLWTVYCYLINTSISAWYILLMTLLCVPYKCNSTFKRKVSHISNVPVYFLDVEIYFDHHFVVVNFLL